MTRSEKFWKRVGIISYAVAAGYCIYFLEQVKLQCVEINVPVTITGKYAQGYSGKHSQGEYLYLMAYNDKHGTMHIPVKPHTYESTNVGDNTSFNLQVRDINGYVGKANDNLIPILSYMLLICIVIISLFILGDNIIKLIKWFNNKLDE